jgi:hypothetical protein
MDNKKTTPNTNHTEQSKEEENNKTINCNIPTSSATSKKKQAMNFGDCGHPPNSVQQFGFASGH